MQLHRFTSIPHGITPQTAPRKSPAGCDPVGLLCVQHRLNGADLSNFTPLLEGVHAAPADRPSVVTVVAAHGDLQPRGGGWAGPCPVCGGDDRFHMKDRGDGTALVGCRGCIDNEPPEVRRKAFGEVMRVLFPDRPAPARSRLNGVATKVSSEQPKSAAGLATVLGGMGCSYRYNVRSARAELHNETGG